MSIGPVKIKKSDGSWAGGAAKPNQVDDYTVADSYSIVPPEGARFCRYELIGAGGGPRSDNTNSCGGGGEYAQGVIDVSALTVPATLTVGAGGAANTDGGDTTFAGLVAHGGKAPSGARYLGLGGGFSTTADPQTITNATFATAGGCGFPDSASAYASSKFGGGVGGFGGTSAGVGGTSASAQGALAAGNGASSWNSTSAGIGGGGSKAANKTLYPGGPGAARLNWIF